MNSHVVISTAHKGKSLRIVPENGQFTVLSRHGNRLSRINRFNSILVSQVEEHLKDAGMPVNEIDYVSIKSTAGNSNIADRTRIISIMKNGNWVNGLDIFEDVSLGLGFNTKSIIFSGYLSDDRKAKLVQITKTGIPQHTTVLESLGFDIPKGNDIAGIFFDFKKDHNLKYMVKPPPVTPNHEESVLLSSFCDVVEALDITAIPITGESHEDRLISLTSSLYNIYHTVKGEYFSPPDITEHDASIIKNAMLSEIFENSPGTVLDFYTILNTLNSSADSFPFSLSKDLSSQIYNIIKQVNERLDVVNTTLITYNDMKIEDGLIIPWKDEDSRFSI